jgi:hypothetical protein
MVCVDIIEADGAVLEPHLPWPRLADVDLLPFHHFRAAVLVDSDSVDHELVPSCKMCGERTFDSLRRMGDTVSMLRCSRHIAAIPRFYGLGEYFTRGRP